MKPVECEEYSTLKDFLKALEEDYDQLANSVAWVIGRPFDIDQLYTQCFNGTLEPQTEEDFCELLTTMRECGERSFNKFVLKTDITDLTEDTIVNTLEKKWYAHPDIMGGMYEEEEPDEEKITPKFLMTTGDQWVEAHGFGKYYFLRICVPG